MSVYQADIRSRRSVSDMKGCESAGLTALECYSCAKCYPDWFTEENGSVADGIQSAVDECTQSGHPVTDLDQASIASALTASAASTSDGGSSTSSTGGSTTSVSQATSASTSSGSTQSQSAPPNAAGKTAVGGSIALIMLTVAAYSLV